MASYVVAASLFVIGTSYMIQFVVEPPGSSISNLEHIALKARGTGLLEILLGTTGLPIDWSASNASVEQIDRLGLIDRGSSGRINATKFDALARGSYATTSNENGAVDYSEARDALGLGGYDFHLRAYPIDRGAQADSYGVEDMSDLRVGYVGKFTSPTAYSTNAKFEADALDALNITFTNLTRSSNALGDVYQGDSNTITQHLLPNIGASLPEEVLGAGAGTKYDFTRAAASTYTGFLTANVSGGESSAMALSSDGLTLGYTKNRELRVIAGIANLTGATSTGNLATINWWEWVDTDRGNGTTDCSDYGYVEVSGDGGATWTQLTDTASTRSQDCFPLYLQGPALTGRSVALTGTACALCKNNAGVLVAFHWTADNDNNIGYGWVVDNLQVVNSTDGKIVGRKTFESPEYDLLVVGSDVDHNAFTPNEIKNAIRDYVDVYGGRLLVLGGDAERNWLDRLLDAGAGGTSGGVSTPDTSHPILTLPNLLSYGGYTAATAWDLSTGTDASLFATVTGTDATHATLAISRQGAWAANGEDGAVMLTSYRPGEWDKSEARRFFANAIVYGKFHYLYLEVGPPVPTGEVVATATRSATMNIIRNGAPVYQEMSFVIYVWPGASTSTASTSAVVRPTEPLSVSAVAVNGQIWVNWTAPVSEGTGTGLKYEVWRGNGPTSMTNLVANRTITPTSNTTFHDHNVTDGTTYWYNVTMWADNGRGRASDAASALPLAYPTAPIGLDATGIVGGAYLTWTPPTTTGPATIYGYTVWVKIDPSADYVYVADVGNATTFTHSLADAGSYTYKVSAVNARGSGPNSSASPTVSPIATLPIAGPTLTVTRIGAGPNNLSLTWVNPIDLGGQTISGFYIWRSAGASNASYSLLATLTDPANLTFLDATLSASITRYYMVQAVTTVMVGYNSSAKSGTTYAVADAPSAFNVTNVTANTLALSWVAPSGNGLALLGYKVLRSADGSAPVEIAVLGGVGGPLNVSFLDATVANNSTYWYQVRAFTDAGDGTLSTTQSMRAAGVPWTVAAPTDGSAVAGTNLVTWSAPNDAGSTITSYEVWRGNATSQTLLVTVYGVTSYVDATPGIGATKYYKVRAINAVGSGPFSTVVAMTS